MKEKARPPLDRMQSSTSHRVRFADFELDLTSCELWQAGKPIALQPQPCRLLVLLVSRRGKIISREEIRTLIWGAVTHLDHEQAINFAVRKIRIALQDSAAAPRFVETLPGTGYRFRSPVEDVPPSAEEEIERGSPGTSKSGKPNRRALSLAALAMLSLLLGLAWLRPDIVRPANASPPWRTGAEHPLTETLTPNTYDLFLEGRYLVANPELGKVQTGTEKLLQVIANAPDLAPAHLALGEGYLRLGGLQKFAAYMPLVEDAARRAIELEPNLAPAHLLLAKTLFFFRHDWPAAQRAVREAKRLDPDDAKALQLYGVMLSAAGRHSEALTLVRRARELDPEAILIASDLAFCLLYSGDLAGAARVAASNLEIMPSHYLSLFLRASVLVQAQDIEAEQAMAKTVSSDSTMDLSAALDWHISAVELRQKAGLSAHFALALLHALSDRPETALEHLRQACDGDPSWELPFALVDPRFEDVHRLPGFVALADCFPPQSQPTD